METLALKKHIHDIINETEDHQLLYTIYNLLKETGTKEGELGNTLTEEEKNEILTAFEESEDDSKLIDSEEIFGHWQ